MAITIGLNPYLIETPLVITWYFIALLAGLAFSTFLAVKLAGKYGLKHRDVLSVILAALPGGLIGARLFHVIDKLEYYTANPHIIPLFWTGGFSQYGMLIGGLISILLYVYWRKLPLVKILDLFSVPLLAGLSIGRVGCIIHGCCHGGPTNSGWGFVYTHPDSLAAAELQGVPVHPTQAYELIWFLVLALILLGMAKHLQTIKGMTFLAFLIGHSAGRFLFFFSRWDYPELQVAAGLAQAQIIALAVLFISLAWLAIHYANNKKSKNVPSGNTHS